MNRKEKYVVLNKNYKAWLKKIYGLEIIFTVERLYNTSKILTNQPLKVFYICCFVKFNNKFRTVTNAIFFSFVGSILIIILTLFLDYYLVVLIS